MGFNHKLTFWRHKLWIFIRNLVIFFFTSSIIMVIVYRYVPVYITPLMLIRCVEYAWNGEDVRVLKKWTPIEEMPEYLVKAAISAEDSKFVENSGFYWEAIQKAYEHNLKHKNIIGGSTISQQTAKNVFLYPRRSYFRKALEAYFTVLIEFFWDKKRIMEVYLNVAETGHGIYGMPMASEIYFEKNLNKLNRTQIATIVALLPSPLTFNPSKQSSRFIRKRNRVMIEADRIIELDLEKKICKRKPYKKKKIEERELSK
ncbi:MAG: monofunctional biosynthetic peptidoglycan transglycosylase [Paludibacteraceae bacterium]|nr:monofunctional biosynthetic peptidoglycan transglycosylase [Paludibacteraceae bacterium]